MCETLFDLAKSTELWAAIMGSVVGGLIALAIQMVALREGRSIRQEDQKRQKEVLANSLVFKCMRILTNVHGIHQHFVDGDARAAADGVNAEPWQKYVPIANPPEPINFSADEMSMLLALKDDAVFNAMLDMDVRHNSLIATLKAFNNSRVALGEAISSVGILDTEAGERLSHLIPSQALATLRPKMIDVNSLAEGLKIASTADLADAKTSTSTS